MAVATAQQWVEPRSNVEPYDDDAAIEKLAYRESPYYHSFSGSWHQRRTDSSIVYSREIDVEKYWSDYQVFLNVRCGRAVRVLLNGNEVGLGDDSRHWNEFLLNGLLKYGKKNQLSIEALVHPKGALLEDASLPVGLNGEPYLLFKSDPNVSDLTLQADYNAATATGSLTITADVFCSKRKGKYYVETIVWDPKGHEFDRMGRWVVFTGKNQESVELVRSWNNVAPWSAESPMLYTAVVRLRNEKMEEEELVGTRFGFRQVEVADGMLRVNDKPITLKGVAYGIEHTEGYASREQMRRDVEQMKRHNINAVHTTRYSPMEPYFYELCDQYGLYVVCDANLLPLSEKHHAVATDQDFIPLFQSRVEHLYGKYKNYTSIIAWSLGNTTDNGVCMTAAYKWLKTLDKTRPVLFAGAEFGESTDIIAVNRPTTQLLRQALSRPGNRPCLMLTAADPAHFANLADLWPMVQNQRQLQGGFIEGWPFSQAMLSELAHLYRPFSVHLSKLSPDEGTFLISNLDQFEGLGRYSLEYVLYTSQRSNITGGDLPMAIRGGGSDNVTLRIPKLDLQAGEEVFVRFDLKYRAGSQPKWITGGRATVATEVISLPIAPLSHQMFVNDGPELSDSADASLPMPRLYFVGHENWTSEVAGSQHHGPDSRTDCNDYLIRYKGSDGTTMCELRLTSTLFSTGDRVLDYTVAPAERLKEPLVPAVELPRGGDTVTWYGLDREVFLPVGHSGIIGTHSLPAAHFRRGQVGWCSAGNLFMRIIDKKCTLQATPHTLTLVLDTSASCAFRLHLASLQKTTPSQLLSTLYPRLASGILEPPVISASEPRFASPLTVTLAAADKDAQIRYTTDGSEPDENSLLYREPLLLTTTTLVKARTFAPGQPPSFVAARRFNYDYILRTRFSRKPNTPYNAGADTLLFDGEKGSVDELSRGWLGFSGKAVNTTVELSKPICIEQLTLRYAHSPATWVFAPVRVAVAFSADGQHFVDTLYATPSFDPTDAEQASPRVVEFHFPVDKDNIGFIEIIPQTIGTIPSWHRAKGLNPWLMTDEIEVSEKVANP